MTVFNGMPYLPLAIESILNQTFEKYEFLIVNDCSTDVTREVILSYHDPRIRLIDNSTNIGQTRSLNVGLEQTRTEFVARMDADDISHPSRLEVQTGFLRAHSKVAAVGMDMNLIDASGRVIGKLHRPQHDLPIRWMQFFENPIPGGVAMFRKSVIWDELGGYNPSIKYSQDWELLSRIPKRYELASIPQIHYDFRTHSGATSHGMSSEITREIQKIYRANLRLLLEIDDDDAVWMASMNLLSEAVSHEHPEFLAVLLESVRAIYKRFCALNPEANHDPAVLDILSRLYFRVVERSRFRSLPKAYQALQLAWRITPKPRYLARLLRLAAGLTGGRTIRDWFRKTRLQFSR
jgi:glycosyltransferase involved in cell wall biosynthesis